MSNLHIGSSNTAASVQGAASFVGTNVKTWIALFALASLTLFVLQPTAIVTGTIAVALMIAIALIAHSSVASFEDGITYDAKQQLVAVLAPAHFACLIWVAVHAGRMIIDTTLVTSSLAAFVALALIVLIDAILSSAVLLAAERGRGVSGASVAVLISNKYVGLLGKIA
jgi:hypothetical protein